MVLVHTSTSPEPFGRVLVEAMFARRPVVAFREGSVAEMLDEESAVFAARPDGEGVADAIRQVIGDPEAAALLAARAVERAKRFAPAVVAQLMDEEYQSLPQLASSRS